MNSESKEVVVDFGSGEVPRVAEYIANSHPEFYVLAIESSGFQKREKQKNLGKVLSVSGFEGELPLKESSVDRFFASFVLGETSDDGYRNLLKEVKRVLKPGGTGFFCEATINEEHVKKLIVDANLEVVRAYSVFPKGSSWGESFDSVSKSVKEWKPIVLVAKK